MTSSRTASIQPLAKVPSDPLRRPVYPFIVFGETIPDSRRSVATHVSGLCERLTEFVVFGLKQAWACVFGAALLAVIIATRLWYPDNAGLARNDFLTIAATAMQVLMISFKLETLRELRVILLFHVVGTVMELFKTDVGSWAYEAEGVLRIGAVPLFSGFMYAAVGSYMVRVSRLFDLRFDRYPRRWITALMAGAIYVNFFSHHYIFDARWVLLAAVVLVYGRCVMHFRVFQRRFRMPILVSFLLVALFIWFAENIGTWSRAWLYPNQLDGWQAVSIDKLMAWFLLMIISVVLVAWDHRPPGPIASTASTHPVSIAVSQSPQVEGNPMPIKWPLRTSLVQLQIQVPPVGLPPSCGNDACIDGWVWAQLGEFPEPCTSCNQVLRLNEDSR